MQLNAKQLQHILDENVKDYEVNKFIEMTFNSLMKIEREAFLQENNDKAEVGSDLKNIFSVGQEN